jgi:hypothetical protein
VENFEWGIEDDEWCIPVHITNLEQLKEYLTDLEKEISSLNADNSKPKGLSGRGLLGICARVRERIRVEEEKARK